MVVHPRLSPTMGMTAFAGVVFALSAFGGTIHALDKHDWVAAALMFGGMAIAGYFAFYGLDACVQRMRVTVSPSDEVTLRWFGAGPSREISFPLASLVNVHVERHSAATARVVLELADPELPIALDAVAVPDDLQPLAKKLRSFLLAA